MLPPTPNVPKKDVPLWAFEDLLSNAGWTVKSERNWIGYNLILTGPDGVQKEIPSNAMNSVTADMIPRPNTGVDRPNWSQDPASQLTPERDATYKYEFVLEVLLQAGIKPSADLVSGWGFPDVSLPVRVEELRAALFPLGYQIRFHTEDTNEGKWPVDALAMNDGTVAYTFLSRGMDDPTNATFDPEAVMPFFTATNSEPPADFAENHPFAVPPQYRGIQQAEAAAPAAAGPAPGAPAANDNNAPPPMANDPLAEQQQALDEQQRQDEGRRQQEEQQREQQREQQQREEQQRQRESEGPRAH